MESTKAGVVEVLRQSGEVVEELRALTREQEEVSQGTMEVRCLMAFET